MLLDKVTSEVNSYFEKKEVNSYFEKKWQGEFLKDIVLK